jgi:hypothetical protein
MRVWWLLILSGCLGTLDLPSRPPTPILEGLLVAGASSHRIRVSWLIPDSGRWAAPPSDVHLTLSDDQGNTVPLRPTDTAGQFIAELLGRAGRHYRLDGTVGEARITAETTIPADLVLIDPAADTVSVDPAVEPISMTIRWRSDGATALTADSGSFFPGYDMTHDSVAQLTLDGFMGDSVRRTLTFRGFNGDADRYLFGRSAGTSNVRGGQGAFGAVILVTRILRLAGR